MVWYLSIVYFWQEMEKMGNVRVWWLGFGIWIPPVLEYLDVSLFLPLYS